MFILLSCSDSEQNSPSSKTTPDNKNTESSETAPTQKNNVDTDISQNAKVNPSSDNQPATDSNNKSSSSNVDYQLLRNKITYGKADYADVLSSLTEENAGGLTNTVHALYSMRWQRKVLHLIYDLWDLKTDLYPELNWKQIEKPPVRIALASTILRIQNLNALAHPDSHMYKEYIRSHKYDEHEFNRAQVVVALGLAGDPVDVPYLKEMAAANNHYVTQSAITGLGLMKNKQASDALIELFNKYRNDARGNLILEMLAKAYNLHPTNLKTDEKNNKP